MPSTKPYADRLNELAGQYGPLHVRSFTQSNEQVDEFMWSLGDGEGGRTGKVIFRPPIGSESEIKEWLEKVDPKKPKWPGAWWEAVRFCEQYTATGRLATHTGADLNLSLPREPYADSDKPVFSIADGVVLCAAQLPTWGYVIVVEHWVDTGVKVWSRYAHLRRDMDVRVNQNVSYGQQLAHIGDYGTPGKPGDHLHFDIAINDCLVTSPAHWPGNKPAMVRAFYTDPLTYIIAHCK